ncbi:hypothetical protein AMECASPLE_004830 [Ameca splendens]|uniref:Uncharacterized protein n=1 Tax=Ameca splendens TaxID=208324 RepID=A0ABV0XYZ0_9TELE
MQYNFFANPCSGTVGLLFSSFIHVWLNCVSKRAGIIPICFVARCLPVFWCCKSSDGAHLARRKAPWRAALKDSAYYEKNSVRRNREIMSTTSPGNLRTIQMEAPIFFDQ